MKIKIDDLNEAPAELVNALEDLIGRVLKDHKFSEGEYQITDLNGNNIGCCEMFAVQEVWDKK